jgi:hypothetical protein
MFDYFVSLLYMVVTLETGLVIGSLLASFTYCCVKIIHQIQNSKCKFINCCGTECIRDVDIDLDEVEVNEQVPPPPAPTRPRLNSINKPNVEELKKRFGQ